jgi:hypothetical protein
MKAYNEIPLKPLRTSQRSKEENTHCACNHNNFVNKIYYKGFLLQLPPIAFSKQRQYSFMKMQVGYLPHREYKAFIDFICDILDF